jgi:hypothetical protein
MYLREALQAGVKHKVDNAYKSYYCFAFGLSDNLVPD